MKLIKEDYDDFDRRWEEEFGPDDEIDVLSAQDAIKLLDEMESFK